MPFKTFTAGVLTSSDVNTFLLQQAVITCTSSTRPSSPVEGMTIYETDTDFYRTWSGSAWEMAITIGGWTSYTPTIQSFGAGTDWALGNGTVTAVSAQFGRLVVVYFNIVFGSTSTFGTKSLGMSLPTNSPGFSYAPASGKAFAYDTSAGISFDIHAHLRFDGLSMIFGANAYPGGGAFTTFDAVIATKPMTWANTDVLTGFIYYRSSA